MKENNAYLSYDQTIKKTGIGLGVFYQFSHSQSDSIPNTWKQNLPTIFKKRLLNNSTAHTVGICISAKYNLKQKKDPTKALCSISPSVFFEFKNENNEVWQHFNHKNYIHTSYNLNNPEGIVYVDSSYSQIVKQNSKEHIFKTGIGFSVNSKNLLLLFKLTHGSDWVQDQINLITYKKNNYQAQTIAKRPKLYNTSEELFLAYSFISKANDRISFTPMTGFGLNLNLKLTGKTTADSIYSYTVQSKNKFDVAFSHISGSLRFHKLLVALTYTRAYNKEYYGTTIGLQTQKHKVLYCFNFGAKTFNEVSYVLVF
jgi:hypothetical protein